MNLILKKINVESKSELMDLQKSLDNSTIGTKKFRYYTKRNFDVMKNHISTFLYYDNEECVGYGHLDYENGEVWLGVIVFDKYVGNGYGKKIVSSLLESYSGPILLTVDLNNIPALNLYLTFGFKIIEKNKNYYKMKKNKTALITGINGQDGSYLAEFLVDRGYEVWGTVKRNSVSETQSNRIDHLRENHKVNLEYADLTDMSSLVSVLQKSQPDEIYNLAAQSHVRISFDQPIYTANVTGVGTLNLLESVRLVSPHSKIYQASSSEMFGNTIDADGYQRETTPMNPVSPYGCAKVFSYNICRNYRNSYGMKIWNGILFNHESPRRGTNFVTNKVVKAAVRISLGLQDKLHIGNLSATRDWGHAKDYVHAMWLMLQSDRPDDYVCATGVSHSVQDLCSYVFSSLGLDYMDYIVVDEKHFRPEELENLKGDSTKLRKELLWQPEYSFETMLDEMINYWLEYYGK
jgi:GDPmannose 4,6-dehydratase